MAGLTFDGIASTRIDSSVFSGASLQVTSVSGTNFNLAGSITDTNGRLQSAALGSPATFGAFVQAGTAGQLLAATGSIVFGRAFSNSNFIVTITPQTSGTLYPYIVSGTGTYSTSGITYGGQSGLAYNWIAVGV